MGYIMLNLLCVSLPLYHKLQFVKHLKQNKMESQPTQLEIYKINRVAHLQKMIEDERKELLKKVSRQNQGLLTSKKYRNYRNILELRVRMTDGFIKNASDSFFTMLSNKEFLMMTTEIDVIQKVEKFKKNTFNSLQKMTHNLDHKSVNRSGSQINISHGGENEDEQNEYMQEVQKKKISRGRRRSKNFKISSDATKAMMQWLLRNFENPYPTTEQKQQMAKQGNISMMKVNNWFINARQRTVKSYFQKDN